MNIFELDLVPKTCAQYHNDKHVVKMIIEYAQLMSTAHRMLDGTEYYDLTASGRKIKRWRHPDAVLEDNLYKATHPNHPSAIWTRQTKQNYLWLFSLWIALLDEYTYRYGKVHACSKLIPYLKSAPQKIKPGARTPVTPAMPDVYKIPGNTVESYRKYYNHDKIELAAWKNREVPYWWSPSTLPPEPKEEITILKDEPMEFVEKNAGVVRGIRTGIRTV